MLTRLLDLAHVVVLARVQARFERQVRHANDGVHRGADFVAHVGQKIGLECCRLLGQVLGAQQVLLGQLAFGDVDKRPDGPARRPIGFQKSMQPKQGVVHLAVCVRQVHFLVHRAHPVQRLGRILIKRRAQLVGQEVQVLHGLADELRAPHAKGLLISPVETDIAPISPFVEQGHRDGIDQRLLEVQLCRHLGFQLLLVVDIDIHAHHAHSTPMLVAEDACGLQEPAHLAIGPHDAPRVPQMVLRAVDAGIEVIAGAVTVLWVQAGQPIVARLGLRVRGKAHHHRQLGRPQNAATEQVHVKDANLSGLLRQLQPLMDFAQRHLGLARFGHILNHPQRSIGKPFHLQPPP